MANPYHLEHKEGLGGGGLYELEKPHWFRLVETATGRVVREWEGMYCADYNGVDWSDGHFTGVVKVELSEDGTFADVHYAGVPHPERVPLP